MNTYAARLGVAAEGILRSLSDMQTTAGTLETADGPRLDLVGELDDAVAMLRDAHDRMGHFLTEAAEDGNAVAERIGHIARDINFRRDLGERLEACRRLFGTPTGFGNSGDSEEHAAFSEKVFSIYTMASERDVHRSILKVSAATPAMIVTTATVAADEDDSLDDMLF